jgi:hypothetical protein
MLTWHQVWPLETTPQPPKLTDRENGTPLHRLTLLWAEQATTFLRITHPRGGHEASPDVEIPDGAHIWRFYP